MMKWLQHPDRHTADDIEDLAYPPSGGRVQMVIKGILIPAVIIYFGVNAWLSEEAIWFGHKSSDLTVHGNTAKALAVVYLSVGSFLHFRWFWGLLPIYWVFEFGTTLSLLGILGGLGFATYYLFI